MSDAQAPQLPDAAKQRPLLLSLTASIFFVFLDTRVVAALLPTMAKSFDITIPRAGLLVSAYMVGYALFQLVYAPVADRVGKIRVVLVTMVIFSVGTFACGFTTSFGLMIALRAITGAMGAAVFPMTIAYIGDTVPYDRRQATIGMLIAGASAANTLSAASGSFIATIFSWQWVFPVFGIGAAACTVVLYIAARREYRVPANKTPALQTYSMAIKHRPLVRLILLSAMEGGLYFGGAAYVSGLFSQRFGMSTLGIGLLISCLGASQLVSAYVLRRALRWWGEATVLTIGGVLMGAGFCLAALMPMWQLEPLAMVTAGFGFTFVHTTLQARASEALPKSRATATTFFSFAVFASSGAGTLLAGGLIPQIGYQNMLISYGCGLFLFTYLVGRFTTPPKPVGI